MAIKRPAILHCAYDEREEDRLEMCHVVISQAQRSENIFARFIFLGGEYMRCYFLPDNGDRDDPSFTSRCPGDGS